MYFFFNTSTLYCVCVFARCKNMVDLRKHMETHSSEPAFHCDVPSCSFTSRAHNTMKIHHRREHEVKEGIFSVILHLHSDMDFNVIHCFVMRPFHNQGNFVARYKCHVCDKCFTRGNSLTVHLHKKHQFKWPSGHPRFRWLSRWQTNQCSNTESEMRWRTDGLFITLSGTRSTTMVSCDCSWFATRAWNSPSS